MSGTGKPRETELPAQAAGRMNKRRRGNRMFRKKEIYPNVTDFSNGRLKEEF